MSWTVALTVASSALGAYQSYTQAKDQKAMYKLQAEQTRAESERKALQYEERANETLRTLNEKISANLTRGYAGGVVAFEGSTALVNTISRTNAGRDFMRDIKNAENALLAGGTQAQIYGNAGDTAYRSGLLSAGSKLAEAGYRYKMIGSAPEKVATRPSSYFDIGGDTSAIG